MMRTNRRTILMMLAPAAAMALLLGACDRPRSGAPVAGAPTSAPSNAPATQAAATEPAGTVMSIDAGRVFFPAARVRLESDGDHLTALAFSDDPPAALKDNYDGNSFYLQLVLDIDDPTKLAGATWSYKAPSSSSEHEDTPFGIFLRGRKTQLIPYDVRAKFSDEEPTKLLIAGQFLVVTEENAKGLPQVSLVAAELPVRVEISDKTTDKDKDKK